MNNVAVIGIVGNSVFLPVDKFHLAGETIEAKSIHFEYGGKGFNQAVAAARWGAQVSFLAAVGNDGYDGIKEFLEKENIEPVLIQKNEPTAFAAIVTDNSGANRVTVYQGAQLNENDVEAFAQHLKDADVLLINNEVNEAVNIAAAELAKKHGVKIVLNPAPYRKTDKRLLEIVDFFTPNEHEAKDLDEFEGVIQTLGDRGCYIKSTGKIISAEKVKAVDTTGAGDTFNGVFAAELSILKETEEAALSAVKASGSSVTKKGAVSSIPYRSEIIK